ncbi:MAG TPA: hypothetical protein VMV46_19695 [Thermoanaerobaculia bacterium]|nr:hypothetical protein [Thermoanaerobaculia bacterium]
MFRSHSLTLLAPLALAVLLASGCSAPAGSEEAPGEEATATTEAAADDTGAVEYQPAFPEEVSADPLTEGDVEQQESAGGDDHSHGADTHTHDEGPDHEHGDGGHSH